MMIKNTNYSQNQITEEKGKLKTTMQLYTILLKHQHNQSTLQYYDY